MAVYVDAKSVHAATAAVCIPPPPPPHLTSHCLRACYTFENSSARRFCLRLCRSTSVTCTQAVSPKVRLNVHGYITSWTDT